MNQYILLAILIVGFIIFSKVIKNSGAGGLKISGEAAKKKLETEKGIILLDVRNRDEYMSRHIPNSILVPVNVLLKEASKRLPDKNAEIIVYCASGSRSSMAVKILLKLGYKHVYNLGGIYRWPYETKSGK